LLESILVLKRYCTKEVINEKTKEISVAIKNIMGNFSWRKRTILTKIITLYYIRARDAVHTFMSVL
jgi:hypothetical protein